MEADRHGQPCGDISFSPAKLFPAFMNILMTPKGVPGRHKAIRTGISLQRPAWIDESGPSNYAISMRLYAGYTATRSHSRHLRSSLLRDISSKWPLLARRFAGQGFETENQYLQVRYFNLVYDEGMRRLLSKTGTSIVFLLL